MGVKRPVALRITEVVPVSHGCFIPDCTGKCQRSVKPSGALVATRVLKSLMAFGPGGSRLARQMTVSPLGRTLRNLKLTLGLALAAALSPGLFKAMISTPNAGATIMANNNKVILRGNLGKDPADYKDKNGKGYVILSLCTQDSYQDKQSQAWKTLPEVWHRVFAFGKTAVIANSFKKGARIEVSGKLSYQTTKVMIDGETRRFTEVTITAWSIKDAQLRKQANQQTSPGSEAA